MNAMADLKRWFGSFGLGVLVLGVIYYLAIFVSNDVRLEYAIGAILLFGSALWLGAKSKNARLSAALLVAPLNVVFGILALTRIPALWPHLLFWLIAALIGSHLSGAAGLRRIRWICGAGVLVVASLWYCLDYVPQEVARAHTHLRDAAAPTFTFQPVGDGPVPTAPRAGRVLVITFFSTTCGPCLAEMPELARAHAELRDKEDIEFVIVASDAGGDTPERLKAFAQRRRLTLPLAYDPGGKTYNAFGFAGVPALVVLDRMGRICLTHEGYNPSEMHFRRDLVQFLRTL